MGKAHLNIWLRDHDCKPLIDCWKVELKIKTCAGVFVQEFDKTIEQQLLPQFQPDSLINITTDRIIIRNGPSGGPFTQSINHIQLDVPPGCYKIKARVCFKRNEETSEHLSIVSCGAHDCVHLLVPEVMTCGKDIVHPGAVEGIIRYIPHEDVKGFVRVININGNLGIENIKNEAIARLNEADELNLPQIQKDAMNTFVNILNEMTNTTTVRKKK